MDRRTWTKLLCKGLTLEVGCEAGKLLKDTDVDWVGIDNLWDLYQPLAGYTPDGRKVIDDLEAYRRSKLQEFRESWRNRNVVLADGFHLPFRQVFDTMLYEEVLEHVKDPVEFLKEGLTVLKENGRILITVPDEYSWPPELKPFEHSGHVHFFRREDLLDIFMKLPVEIKLLWRSSPIYNQGFIFFYAILTKG